MAAGTITLTNGSASVGGTGTSFTTELKAGDFIGVTVGGSPYTMIVAAIDSNTQLTIGLAYNGPAASGLAWYGVPASLKYAIEQSVLNDMASNLRGMTAQMINWQEIYSDAASVTVERSDRSTFTGPSWGYIANQYGNKVDKSSIGSIASQSAGAVAITGGNIRNVTIQSSSATFDNLGINNAAGAAAFRLNSGVPAGVDLQMITAWVTFRVNPSTLAVTITNAFNVSSINRVGVGVYYINFTTAMANTNYGWSGSVRSSSSAEVPHCLFNSVGDLKNVGQMVVRAAYASGGTTGTFDPAETTVYFMGGK